MMPAFLRRPLFIVLVAILAFIGFRGVSFNVNIVDLLPPDLPEVKGLNRFMEDFGMMGELIVTLSEKDAEHLEEAAQSLAEHLRSHTDLVHRAAWQPAWIESPAAAAELPAFLWLNGPPEHVAALAERLEPDPVTARLEEALAALAGSLDPQEIGMSGYDPLGLLTPGNGEGFNPDDAGIGRGDAQFVSEDGTFRCLYVDPPEGVSNYKQQVGWIAKLREAIEAWRADDPARADIVVHYTGEPAFQAEIGGGMEEDMSGSVGLTGLLIMLLFWIMHRRLAPLFNMSILLVLILSITIIAGRLFFGELSVMSVGFAAILLGLAIDYGVIIYQEARQHPTLSGRELRRSITPTILWASITTAAVFFVLNFSSLPGITQLGTLVGTGILVGAAVMLLLFTPGAARAARVVPAPPLSTSTRSHPRLALVFSLFVPLLGAGLLAWKGFPPLYTSFDALRPKVSPASDALDELTKRLTPEGGERLPLIVTAESSDAMTGKLPSVIAALDASVAAGHLRGYALVPDLWANRAHQEENRRTFMEKILPKEESLAVALDGAGFAEDPIQLVHTLFDAWRGLLDGPVPSRPHGETSARLLRNIILDGPERFSLLGFADPLPGVAPDVASRALEIPGVYVTGWRTLGPAVKPLITHDVRGVFTPMAGVLALMLVLVFRNWRDVTLALACMLFATVTLLATMSVFGMQWNFVNICAFPLLLGTSIDYAIHMILALKRENGDLPTIRRGISRALIFCGGSTMIAFGALARSSNSGLASLGFVCGAGILITMLTAVTFLPHWWRWLNRGHLA
jgi:predicted exporter